MRTILKTVGAVLVIAQLAACSTYDGPVTNAPAESNISGPPLLTGGFAP